MPFPHILYEQKKSKINTLPFPLFKLTIVTDRPTGILLFFYVQISRVSKQGSKGIRQWQINQFTSSIIIHKITPSVDYN